MFEIKNKEVDDALHMLLHCSLKDYEYKTQKEQFDIIHDYIKELENKVEVQTICGYSIEEAIQILSAVTIERTYDIKVTMSKLKEIVELYQKEQTEMVKETLSKIDVEWPPGGKEITIHKVDMEALEDYR